MTQSGHRRTSKWSTAAFRPPGRRLLHRSPLEAQDADTLVRQLSEAPRREIEGLVGKLMTLHKKLQADGDRIQFDIEEYSELNRRVRQLTAIVSDSVGKLPVPCVS